MTFDTTDLFRSERHVLGYFIDAIGTDSNKVPNNTTVTRLRQLTLDSTPANGRSPAFVTIMNALTSAPNIFLAAQDLRNALAGVKV